MNKLLPNETNVAFKLKIRFRVSARSPILKVFRFYHAMHLGLLLMKVTDCLNGPLIKGTHGNALFVMIKSCKHRNSCNLHVEPLILKHNTILHRKRLFNLQILLERISNLTTKILRRLSTRIYFMNLNLDALKSMYLYVARKNKTI